MRKVGKKRAMRKVGKKRTLPTLHDFHTYLSLVYKFLREEEFTNRCSSTKYRYELINEAM